jgi:hypothetical protein
MSDRESTDDFLKIDFFTTKKYLSSNRNFIENGIGNTKK